MADERKRSLSFSSEKPVRRWYGFEVLDHNPKSVRMQFMASGRAPLLLNHHKRIGVVEVAKLVSKRGEATVRFGRSADSEDALRDVDDGILQNTSVGYIVHELRFESEKDGIETYRVTDWEPYEATLCDVPADTSVGVGRSAETQPAQPTLETEKPKGEAGTKANRAAPGASKRKRAPAQSRNQLESNMDIQEQLRELQEQRSALTDELKAFGNPAELDDDQTREFDRVTGELDACNEKLKRTQKMADAMEQANPVEEREVSRHVRDDRQPRQAPRIQGVEPAKEEPGIMFARAVRCMFVGKESNRNPMDVARDLYGSGPVGRQVREAVTAGSTASGNWGAPLYQANAAAVEFLQWLAPQTLIGKFGVNGVPALTPVDFGVPLVAQTTQANGYWVGQGAAKGVTLLGFSTDTIVEYEVAAIIALSDRLRRRGNATNVDALIRNALAQGIIARKDSTFMSLDPADPGIAPAGLLNDLSPNASAGNTAEDVRTDIVALQESLNTLHYPLSGTVLVISTSLAIRLMAMTNPLGQPEFPGITRNGGTLLGLPVLVTDYMPTSSNGGVVALVHAPNVFYAEDGAESLVSQHATLYLDTAPASNAPNNSLYQRNQTGVRISQPVGWAKRTGAIVAIDDVDWGAAS